jgi:hypothetical protein
MKIGIEAVASCMPEGVVTLEDYAYLAPVIPPDVEYPKEVRRLTVSLRVTGKAVMNIIPLQSVIKTVLRWKCRIVRSSLQRNG